MALAGHPDLRVGDGSGRPSQPRKTIFSEVDLSWIGIGSSNWTNLKLKGIDGGSFYWAFLGLHVSCRVVVVHRGEPWTVKRGSALTLAPPPGSWVSLGLGTCCKLSGRVSFFLVRGRWMRVPLPTNSKRKSFLRPILWKCSLRGSMFASQSTVDRSNVASGHEAESLPSVMWIRHGEACCL